MEQWRDIKGYEDLYQISQYGEVKSLRKNKNLKGGISGFGYRFIYLVKNKKIKQKYIHKLVAETFIENPDNLPRVNHKNGIKTDNRAENLEWISVSDNNKHAYKTGLKSSLKGKNNYYSKSLMTPINQYDLQGNFIRKWNSQREAANSLGISQQNISECVRGIKKKTHNYIWRYANER